MDSVRHQLGDRQQAAELEGGDQLSRYTLVRCRRPGSVEPMGSAADQRLGRC
jgi:hypothetical protein